MVVTDAAERSYQLAPGKQTGCCSNWKAGVRDVRRHGAGSGFRRQGMVVAAPPGSGSDGSGWWSVHQAGGFRHR